MTTNPTTILVTDYTALGAAGKTFPALPDDAALRALKRTDITWIRTKVFKGVEFYEAAILVGDQCYRLSPAMISKVAEFTPAVTRLKAQLQQDRNLKLQFADGLPMVPYSVYSVLRQAAFRSKGISYDDGDTNPAAHCDFDPTPRPCEAPPQKRVHTEVESAPLAPPPPPPPAAADIVAQPASRYGLSNGQLVQDCINPDIAGIAYSPAYAETLAKLPVRPDSFEKLGCTDGAAMRPGLAARFAVIVAFRPRVVAPRELPADADALVELVTSPAGIFTESATMTIAHPELPLFAECVNRMTANPDTFAQLQTRLVATLGDANSTLDTFVARFEAHCNAYKWPEDTSIPPSDRTMLIRNAVVTAIVSLFNIEQPC